MRFSILEDDQTMRETIAGWLTEAGHDVHAFETARDFIRFSSRESVDLALLDSNLPDQNGEDVLRWMRQDRGDTTPVVFVTARDTEQDIVSALKAGADDYMIKPVRQAELMARVEAVLRRSQPATAAWFEDGPYRFDLAQKQLYVDGDPVELTDKEFELASFLFRNIGRLLSRGHLLEAVWGRSPTVATRTVDTHVSRVRSKLQLRPDRGFRLTPAYNYGYRLERIEDGQSGQS